MNIICKLETIYDLKNDIVVMYGKNTAKIIHGIEELYLPIIEKHLINGQLLTTESNINIINYPTKEELLTNIIYADNKECIKTFVDDVTFFDYKIIKRNLCIIKGGQKKVIIYYHDRGYITVEGIFDEEPNGLCVIKLHLYVNTTYSYYRGCFTNGKMDGLFVRVYMRYANILPTNTNRDICFYRNGTKYFKDINIESRINKIEEYSIDYKDVFDNSTEGRKGCLYLCYKANNRIEIIFTRSDMVQYSAYFSMCARKISLIKIIVTPNMYYGGFRIRLLEKCIRVTEFATLNGKLIKPYVDVTYPYIKPMINASFKDILFRYNI